jgi:DNA-binding transcriptional ArsR family regulator
VPDEPRERALPDDDVTELAEIFSALGDPTRVRIIYSILDRERSVGDIASYLGLSEPSVSQHLRRLKALRVVRLRKAGRHRFYQLDDDHIATLLSVCLDHVKNDA